MSADGLHTSTENIARAIPNAVYLPLGKNEGIARALNIGCKRAVQAGSKNSLLMKLTMTTACALYSAGIKTAAAMKP